MESNSDNVTPDEHTVEGEVNNLWANINLKMSSRAYQIQHMVYTVSKKYFQYL